MAISTLPPAPDPATDTPAQFSTKAAALVAALATFVSEANTTAAAMTAIAAGGAFSIPYTFSTTTTDSDPGNGNLRLSSATQNTSTVIRLDPISAAGSDWTAAIGVFDDSTSTNKGYITLRKAADGTKWLVFAVSALASPTGYVNLTVTPVAGSAASPFGNGDSIVLDFSPVGDKGATGNTGPAATIGDHEVVVQQGNGHGSTNTKIRRFGSTVANVGTAITYADSATNGGSFTINETGLYSVWYSDAKGSGSGIIGISVNSNQLTTSIPSITDAHRRGIADVAGGAASGCGRVLGLTAADVVRAHTDGAPDDAAVRSYFAIRKVGLIS